jgi:hypothetical protein
MLVRSETEPQSSNSKNCLSTMLDKQKMRATTTQHFAIRHNPHTFLKITLEAAPANNFHIQLNCLDLLHKPT